jgi:inhibitor of cysteine peptidase
MSDTGEVSAMHRSVRVVAVLSIVLPVALVVACTATPQTPAPVSGTMRVDATADGTTIRLKQGAELVVSLDSNPSTGFDWKVVESLPPQLTEKDDAFESSATPGVVGAGGKRVLTYTAAAFGTGDLDLEYVRYWEKGVPPERTFALTVIVE